MFYITGCGRLGSRGEWRKTRGRFFASLKNDRDAGVKCGRRGAVRAATANRGLRFLGFARNDRGALWWNDIGRYGGRASGRALARDARRFFASLKNDRDAGVKCGRRGAVRAADANRRLRFLGFARNDRGALWWNDIGRYGGRASGRALARDARRFFASLKNDRGGEGGGGSISRAAGLA